jgi:hypothetical protein
MFRRKEGGEKRMKEWESEVVDCDDFYSKANCTILILPVWCCECYPRHFLHLSPSRPPHKALSWARLGKRLCDVLVSVFNESRNANHSSKPF